MSTHVYCRDCGELIERYEDDEPLHELLEQCGLCRRHDLDDAGLMVSTPADGSGRPDA